MQAKRNMENGKRIFDEEHKDLLEFFIYRYSEKMDVFPIDAICEIREYMEQQIDELHEQMERL
jgi:DNA-binding transcriptional MerR regulator